MVNIPRSRRVIIERKSPFAEASARYVVKRRRALLMIQDRLRIGIGALPSATMQLSVARVMEIT